MTLSSVPAAAAALSADALADVSAAAADCAAALADPLAASADVAALAADLLAALALPAAAFALDCAAAADPAAAAALSCAAAIAPCAASLASSTSLTQPLCVSVSGGVRLGAIAVAAITDLATLSSTVATISIAPSPATAIASMSGDHVITPVSLTSALTMRAVSPRVRRCISVSRAPG